MFPDTLEVEESLVASHGAGLRMQMLQQGGVPHNAHKRTNGTAETTTMPRKQLPEPQDEAQCFTHAGMEEEHNAKVFTSDCLR